MGKKIKFENFGFPPQLSNEELTRIYGAVPRGDNFLSKGKRIRLKRFTGPFKGDGREVAAKFRRNLDSPLSRCFEEQLDAFVRKTLDIHWNKEVPITGGMIRVLKRMGRAGILFRHGFNPGSYEQQLAEKIELEKQNKLEIEKNRMIQEKAQKFLEERSIKRQDAQKMFDSLQQEDQCRLQKEFEYAKEDPAIKVRGGKFEDFLIHKFDIKITFFEEIKKVHKIGKSLEIINSNLEEAIYKRKKNDINSIEFVRIYKTSKDELNELDCELNSLEET
jgi:hypothetical protein